MQPDPRERERERESMTAPRWADLLREDMEHRGLRDEETRRRIVKAVSMGYESGLALELDDQRIRDGAAGLPLLTLGRGPCGRSACTDPTCAMTPVSAAPKVGWHKLPSSRTRSLVGRRTAT